MAMENITVNTSTVSSALPFSSSYLTSSAASASSSPMENASSNLPESHRWPLSDRPKVAHNEYMTGLELPIIDLQQNELACLLKVGEACKKWGFFHVVNHGVPQELMKKMEHLCTSFFSLPAEKKMEITQGNRMFRLYDNFTRKKYTACAWVEGLNVHDMCTIPHIASAVWPEESKNVSETFVEYLEEMKKLGKRILRLLILSLGLKEAAAGAILNGCGFTGTRFNYYPACPDPSMVLGLVPHTDPNCVTILHQDDVGGLQIAKDNQWIAVKPIENAFVINIGDSFQAWSNCRYKSVEHRAVVNSHKPRVSIAYFYGPTEDFIIEPPKELVDHEYPLVHRPFLYKDYMSWRTQSSHFGKKAFDVFAHPDFVK